MHFFACLIDVALRPKNKNYFFLSKNVQFINLDTAISPANHGYGYKIDKGFKSYKKILFNV